MNKLLRTWVSLILSSPEKAMALYQRAAEPGDEAAQQELMKIGQ